MERNRGLDLLRLFAGMAVVMLHYNYGYAFPLIDGVSTPNRLLLYGMEALCVPAVNVFLLISGYFLIRTEKRSLGKVLNLFILVVFFRELFYLGPIVLGRHHFEWNLFLSALVPNVYFIVLYSVVYLLSPYINIIIKLLSNKGILRLLLILFLLLSVEPWLVDILENTTHSKWLGMNMVAFSGADGGQTLVHFIFIYVIGACLSKLEISDYFINIKWGGVYIATTIIIFISFITKWFGSPYYSPFVILQSVSLFYLFRHVNCAAFFSRLSKAALTCYIIHLPFLHFLKIDYYIQQPPYILALQIVVSLVAIYLLSFVFMTVYDFVFAKPQNKLNKIIMDYKLD